MFVWKLSVSLTSVRCILNGFEHACINCVCECELYCGQLYNLCCVIKKTSEIVLGFVENNSFRKQVMPFNNLRFKFYLLTKEIVTQSKCK